MTDLPTNIHDLRIYATSRHTVTQEGSKVAKNILLYENLTINESICLKVCNCPSGDGWVLSMHLLMCLCVLYGVVIFGKICRKKMNPKRPL